MVIWLVGKDNLPVGFFFIFHRIGEVVVSIYPDGASSICLYDCSIYIGGGLTVLFFIVWAEVFGKRDVGRIQGAAQMISVFASAIGPVFFAYSKEWTESYTLAFFVSGGLTDIVCFLGSCCTGPLKPES